MYKNMKIGTSQVYVGEGEDVVRELFDGLGECTLCAVYGEGVADIAERVIAELKKVYRVHSVKISSRAKGGEEQAPPEYIRHVFGIGTGSVAKKCKALAERYGVDWSLFLTAPTTDSIMCGKSPKNVFISQNVMLNCPSCCLAAGYGILFSEQLRGFEALFSNKVLALSAGETPSVREAKDAVELALALLEISVGRQGSDSAELMAELMYFIAKKQGKRPRLIGEYKFLASSLLSEFYSDILGAPSIDCMPPSCLDSALDMLNYLEAKDIIPPKSVDFFDTNAYFRISYILGEYRMDLLEKLGGFDARSKQRFWRRLYPDAGYWLKSEVTVDEMLKAMSLAGAFSDSLLGYAFASGITARLSAG